MYELRYATRFDVNRVKKLLESAKDIFGFIPRPAVWHSMAKGELIVATCYIAPQSVIGFCRYHRRRDGITTVYEIYVVPGHRQEGLGKQMINSLKGTIQAKCPIDYDSNWFYRHLGFELTGIEAGRRKRLNIWRRKSCG